MRLTSTERARETVRRVAAGGKQDLVMVLGTGCCDSTAPFLYDRYTLDAGAVRVGEVAGVPVFAHAWLARLYEQGRGLEVDVDEGVVNDSLSLESDLDCRFTLRVAETASASA